VAWAVSHDDRNHLRPSPFQRAPSPPMTPVLARACRRAVHVVAPDGRVLRAGRAALYVLRAIGWPSLLVQVLSLPPLIWLVEVGYRIVADNRSFFGRFLFTNTPVDATEVGEGPGGP
jgi:predicted DCC family thiol-disulfide oxidoreductase YuxK